MSWVYAPCSGVVRALASSGAREAVLASADQGLGPALVLEMVPGSHAREAIIVAPVDGVISTIDDGEVIVSSGPDHLSPGVCEAVTVHWPHTELPLEASVEAGDFVRAGQSILRGRVPNTQVAVVVEVVRPVGEILCERMDTLVYTAEPLLRIVREEGSIVEIDPDSRVVWPAPETLAKAESADATLKPEA